MDRVKADFKESAVLVYTNNKCRAITHIPQSELVVFALIDRPELDHIPWEAPNANHIRTLKDNVWELSHFSAWHDNLFVRQQAGVHAESVLDLDGKPKQHPESSPRITVAQVQCARKREHEQEQGPRESCELSKDEKEVLLLHYREALKMSAEGGGVLVDLERN